MRLKLPIYRYITSAIVMCALTEVGYSANTTESYVYGDGVTTLEGNLEKYDATVPSEITITGTGDSIVSGGSLYNGYQFAPAYGVTAKTTITVSGIKEFRDFRDSVDGSKYSPEGGSVFYLSGGAHLVFDKSFYNEDNRLIFRSDSATSDGNHSEGGAISIQYGGSMGDIYADFYSNHAIFPSEHTGTNHIYGRGGAINVGGTGGEASVGKIYGTFKGNTAEYGGAIYVGTSGSIGDITGRFEGNHVSASYKGGSTGGSAGGAIRVFHGEISSINADFIGNTVYATGDTDDNTSQGGAIALRSATFANKEANIQGTISKNISFSNSSHAYGGAFYLLDQVGENIVNINDSTITGNIAGTTSTTAQAQGGAFYIDLSNAVHINAVNKDVLISGNYEVVGGTRNGDAENGYTVTGGTRDYNAIVAVDSTITLSAKNDNKITINDSIESLRNSAIVLNSTSSKKYDIELNAEIRNMDVVVNNGGLILGSYTHEPDGVNITTTANFKGGTLSVEADAARGTYGIVNTAAENLNGATAIYNQGTIEFTGGTLTQGINSTAKSAFNMPASSSEEAIVIAGASAGAKTGSLHILGETTFASSVNVYGDSIFIDDKLHVATAASVDVNTLLYQGANMHEINSQEHIVLAADATLAFDTVKLNIDSATSLDFFDLVIGDGTGDIADLYSSEFEVEFTLGGKLLTRNIDYIVEERAEDGGLRVRFIGDDSVIPEPSTATLSLLALTALIARRRRKS